MNVKMKCHLRVRGGNLHQLVILVLCRTGTSLSDTKKGSPRDVRPIGITLREKKGFSEVKCLGFFFLQLALSSI